MNDNAPTRPSMPLLQAAGQNGVYLGVYLILLAVFAGLGMSFQAATFMVWAGSIYLPFFLYRLILRNQADSGFKRNPTELWALGICSYMFAALLQAVVVYVVLRFVVPTFIAEQINASIALCRELGSTEGDNLADNLQALVDATGYPTPVSVASNLIVFNIFASAILSLIVSLAIQIRYRYAARREEYLRKHFKK